MKALILACVLLATNSFAQGSITGVWTTKNKDCKIRIYEDQGKYHGKITWIKDALDKDNKPVTDNKNPDEALRGRKLEGLVILSNFVYDGDNEWTDGKIYDPESGSTYSCTMELEEGRLKIRGYILLSLFGRTEIWEKAE
jgi:uncharacterized protein (DUF2147 family)